MSQGANAPGFTLPDAQGRPMTLSALLAMGRVELTAILDALRVVRS